MVLSNKNSLVTLGAPSKPNKPPNIDNNSTTPDELHTSPSLNYLTAITGKLSSSDPRVVTKSSTVTLNANCRPSASATSAPTYISILNDPLRPVTPVTYKIGSSDYSVTFTIPPAHRHLDVEFLTKLREAFPYGVGYAVQHKEEGLSLSVEVALASEEACINAVNKPVVLHDFQFHATRTFPTSLTRFNFSGVPMESPSETKETLAKLFSPFGRIVDIVLHLDDVSSQWFRGNGHILVETKESDPNNTSPTYKLDYNGKTSILVTWAKMPKHCRYCKAMGHTRETCSERPSEIRTCFTCGVKGHLRVNCTRASPSEPEPSKRSRRIAPESAITTRSILKPRLPSQRHNTSQSSKWAPIVDKTSTNTTDTSLEGTDPDEEHSSTAASPTHSDGDADMGSTEPVDPSLTHSDDDDVDMQVAEATVTNEDLSPPINTVIPNTDIPDQSYSANTSDKQLTKKSSITTSTIPTRSSPRKNKGLHSGRLDPGNPQ
ncbi:hypothetical protein G6F37_010607 [Rhizopus arrhizus]|nr:hypothetical protein G6F38_010636 [Rhizopus arrhizus]KAG1153161.1 hypothetical protein G6F37_010607 [Rhizopus arrhizus]